MARRPSPPFPLATVGRCESVAPCPVSAVEAFEEVMDSLCVPQYNKDGEERVLLFLKMASGHSFEPELVKSIRNAIRVGLSARHVPSLILETKGIPVGPPPPGSGSGSGSCPRAVATRCAVGSPGAPTRWGSSRSLFCFIYSLSALPGNPVFFFPNISPF